MQTIYMRLRLKRPKKGGYSWVVIDAITERVLKLYVPVKKYRRETERKRS